MPPHDNDDIVPPSSRGDDPSASPPLHVRALDAFEAFYRQVGVVSQRIAELRVAFESLPISSVILIAADLSCAWGVLHARLELLEAVTNDDAGRDLWTHPMMELMRSQLRALLPDAVAYVSRHPEGRRVLAQLGRLATALAFDEQIARAMSRNASRSSQDAIEVIDGSAGSGHRVPMAIDPSHDGRPARCRMLRGWRGPTRWRPWRAPT